MIKVEQEINQNDLCWIHLNNIKTFIYLSANEFEEKLAKTLL